MRVNNCVFGDLTNCCPLALGAHLSPPPILPGGLLSFVEGSIREVDIQGSLTISQDLAFPCPVRGFEKSLLSLLRWLFGAYSQGTTSGIVWSQP